jgi:FolB domain-containing protein
MSTLRLEDLELSVHLGWPEDERRALQTVRVRLELEFPEPPVACRTDDLADAVDYASVVAALRALAAERSFRLLEHLTHEALRVVRDLVPPRIGLVLRITKFPALDGLVGGAAFTLEDPGLG